jgi:5-methylcytosine-specific restriction protein A
LRGKIAIEHLTNEKIGHREFDKTFLGLDSNYTRGFQSMGILHYQGLTKDHHGVLKNNTIQEIINIVKVMDNNQRLLNDITSYFKNKPINKNMLDKELEDKVINSIKDDEKSRNSRIKNYNGIPQKVETVSYSYIRNPDIVAAALIRANGICELCKKQAPFLRRKDNTPYLEVHHKISLSDDGLDILDNVLALCPNCHRKLHHGIN